MKELLTTSLNRQFEEYYNARVGGAVNTGSVFLYRKIHLDVGLLSEIELPNELKDPFESLEFPFLKIKLFGFEEFDEIFIHNKIIASFFYLEFQYLKSNVFVEILYKEFDKNIRHILFFIFLSGYIEGMKSFETLVEKEVNSLDIYSEFPYESALYKLFCKNKMFQYNLNIIDDALIFEYGLNNAITYKCWAIIHDQPIRSFREQFEAEVNIRDQRIKLETDTITARIYFQKLLNFEHRGRIEKIFTEEQLDSFLRANFVDFGEKTNFLPVKLPRNFKVVIRRYFRNFDVKYHSKSHIVAYVKLLRSCFIDFNKVKYRSLYLNFNK